MKSNGSHKNCNLYNSVVFVILHNTLKEIKFEW